MNCRRLPVALIGLTLSTVVTVGVCRADVLILKDGQRIEGDVKRTSEGYRVTSPDGSVQLLTTDRVESIELKRSAAPATRPTDAAIDPVDGGKLASLRRSVDNLPDLKVILERYDRFIDQNTNTPVADEARTDRAMWKDRLDQGMVKVGTKWVTPAERDTIYARAALSADEARQLLKGGRLRDAETSLNKALIEDPTNVTAMYLRGVLAYRTDRLPVARQSFDAVNVSVPDHAPTLNNLGVVAWRQNQHAGALNFYDQAMQTAPLDKDVLNNVAEALNALPDNVRTGTVAQRVARRFTEQDTQLQQDLATQGWYRWGATWVTQSQLDQLKIAEQQVQDKLDKMAGDFDAVQSRIRSIEVSVESNNRSIRQLEANQWGRDANGNPVRFALPQVYYDLVADNRRLSAERAVEVRRLDDLRAAATRIRQQGPQPRFTGVHKLMDENAAPVLLAPVTPTTQPAM